LKKKNKQQQRKGKRKRRQATKSGSEEKKKTTGGRDSNLSLSRKRRELNYTRWKVIPKGKKGHTGDLEKRRRRTGIRISHVQKKKYRDSFEGGKKR